jgi:hypothetical protein
MSRTQGKLTHRSFSIYAADGKTPVADTCLTNSVPDNDEANARRLVACWNACDLMPTEDVERLAEIGEGVMRLSVLADDNRVERDRLSAINAELLEALETLMGVIISAGLSNLSRGVQLGPTVWYVKASDAMDSAKAAIAKAHGDEP